MPHPKTAMAAAAAFVLATTTVSTSPAFGSLPVSTGATAARHVVDCHFDAEDPIRHAAAGTITAIGRITSCVPSDPDTCRLETDIELWNTYLTQPTWVTVATSGPKYGPPCAGISQKATASCEHSASTHKYRALTIISAVEDGDPDTKADVSNSVSYSCLA